MCEYGFSYWLPCRHTVEVMIGQPCAACRNTSAGPDAELDPDNCSERHNAGTYRQGFAECPICEETQKRKIELAAEEALGEAVRVELERQMVEDPPNSPISADSPEGSQGDESCSASSSMVTEWGSKPIFLIRQATGCAIESDPAGQQWLDPKNRDGYTGQSGVDVDHQDSAWKHRAQVGQAPGANRSAGSRSCACSTGLSSGANVARSLLVESEEDSASEYVDPKEVW